jgi:3-methyladenine DNA glycosylase/8-oxoguanine DNA glycosylase
VHQVAAAVRMQTKYLREVILMTNDFKVGDHVEWNSEAGRQKGRYLIELSRTFLDGQFSSETLSHLGNEAAVERLRELRGVGRWTAEYVLLRGLRRLDVYPGDDVGARNNLQRWLKLKKPLDYESVRRVIAKWQPYAGFIYFHLLLDRLTEAGHLPPGLPSKSDSKVSSG